MAENSKVKQRTLKEFYINDTAIAIALIVVQLMFIWLSIATMTYTMNIITVISEAIAIALLIKALINIAKSLRQKKISTIKTKQHIIKSEKNMINSIIAMLIGLITCYDLEITTVLLYIALTYVIYRSSLKRLNQLKDIIQVDKSKAQEGKEYGSKG